MPASKMTSKGQVTIPKAIREQMGVRPGDRIRFTVREDGLIVVEPETRDVRSLAGMLKREGARPISVEEMNEAIVDAVVDSMRRC